MSRRIKRQGTSRTSALTAAGALGAATAVAFAGAPAPAAAQPPAPAHSPQADPLAALRAPGTLSHTPPGLQSRSTGPTTHVTGPSVAPPQSRSSQVLYTVRAGDTVGHLAARYGTTVGAIVQANNLNSAALIRVGQVLRIPGQAAASTSNAGSSSSGSSSSGSSSSGSGTSSARTHTVRAGDTVGHLAARYGTTVGAIVRANNLNSAALIRVGQHLTIPGANSSGSSGSSSSGSTGSSSSGSGSSSSSGSGTSSARTHTVRAGDTVGHLAARYGTTVGAIVRANNLNSAALIRVGQHLTIPGANSSGSSGSSSSGSSGSGSSNSGSSGSSSSATTHTVRAGETLTHIGRQYGVSVSRIADANNLTGSLLHIGQRLTIPAPVTSSGDLIPNTFLHYTYPADVVAAANENKRTLLGMDVPDRAQMQQLIRRTAIEMGVDPALALAIAHQESGFDARAVSPANAVGAMQVIPSAGLWASDLVGRRLNLLDPRDNAVAGVAILRALVQTSPDLPTAIASYYQGAGSVRSNGMYADTRRYVANVQTLMTRFS